MEELIARVVAATGLGEEVAEKAVGLILAYLAKEGPAEEVSKLMDGMPGSREAVARSDGGGGGLTGGLLAKMGGTGGIMALATRLMAAGVPMDKMQTLGHEILAFGRETAGEDVVTKMVAKIPGLSQFD